MSWSQIQNFPTWLVWKELQYFLPRDHKLRRRTISMSLRVNSRTSNQSAEVQSYLNQVTSTLKTPSSLQTMLGSQEVPSRSLASRTPPTAPSSSTTTLFPTTQHLSRVEHSTTIPATCQMGSPKTDTSTIQHYMDKMWDHMHIPWGLSARTDDGTRV